MAEENVVRRDGRTRIKDLEEVDTKGSVLALQTDTETQEESVVMLPSPGPDLMVVANTPHGLAQSQDQLIEWVGRKVAFIEEEIKSHQENLDAAVEAKIRTTPWKNLLLKARRRLKYYEKMQDALVAGYYIVPDFPINVIAVRTKRLTPKESGAELTYRTPNDERHQGLPSGEGDYVNPRNTTYETRHEVTDKEGNPKSVTRYVVHDMFGEIDFPVRLLRPQILRDFSRAIKSKVFDEIGVLPDNSRHSDPMIVGRIELRDGGERKSCSFLVAWWIPTETL
jgi:hypothetical protein